MDLSWQSNIYAFSYAVLVCHSSPSFNFMAAVTICSDFGAQENKIYSVAVSIVSPYICHEMMGLDAMIFVF